ncbi:putative cytochrome P450 [Xylaria castorea]|nr:putative cytochrome P450 [Xylaria castorea]
MLILLALCPVLVYTGWGLVCLEVNVRKARALGVPVVRTPFDVNGYLWMVAQPLVWKLLAFIPVPWSSYPDFVRFSHRNWAYLENSSPTTRFGPAWALVSPGGVHLHLADPTAIEDIFSRRREFVRPVYKYGALAIYGASLFNVSIEEWPRHRKAVAAPFNESVMKFVWHESMRQSRSMAGYWTNQSAVGIPDMQRDLRTVTLNVLASSIFLETYDFIGSTNLKLKELSTIESFRSALLLVHHYIIYLIVIPYQYLVGPMVPRGLSKVAHAAKHLKDIMTKIIERERTAIKNGKPGSGGLVASLTRATDHTSKKGTLSLEEALSNIFLVNFAGIDTTANVLAFLVMRLASEPSTQHWLHEEITTVTQGRPVEDWEYDLFPRFKRCMAVFLETLRMYSPVTALPKITPSGVRTVQVGERLITIAPGTEVFVMIHGIQTDSKHWPDPLVWNPSRWILRSKTPDKIDGEKLLEPQKGIFCPWSAGAQNCVGAKVSQVESVAVLASLLATHHLRVKAKPGETEEHIRKRVEDCCNDNNFNILLEMNNPAQIGLECVPITDQYPGCGHDEDKGDNTQG